MFTIAPPLDLPNIDTMERMLHPTSAIVRDLESLKLPAISLNDGFEIITTTGTYRVTLDSPKPDFKASDSVPMKTEIIELPIELVQQEGNACGPTSLTMVVNSLGEKITAEEVAVLSRCSPVLGTSPESLRDAAQSLGFHSVILTESSPAELAKLIKDGSYPILLVQAGNALHYRVVNGTQINNDGEREFMITDPNGFQSVESASSVSNEWNDLTLLGGLDTGLNRVVVVVSKNDNLPSERWSTRGHMLSILHSGASNIIEFGRFVKDNGVTLLGQLTLAFQPFLSTLFLSQSLFGVSVGEMVSGIMRPFGRAVQKLREIFGRSKGAQAPQECKVSKRPAVVKDAPSFAIEIRS